MPHLQVKYIFYLSKTLSASGIHPSTKFTLNKNIFYLLNNFNHCVVVCCASLPFIFHHQQKQNMKMICQTINDSTKKNSFIHPFL